MQETSPKKLPAVRVRTILAEDLPSLYSISCFTLAALLNCRLWTSNPPFRMTYILPSGSAFCEITLSSGAEYCTSIEFTMRLSAFLNCVSLLSVNYSTFGLLMWALCDFEKASLKSSRMSTRSRMKAVVLRRMSLKIVAVTVILKDGFTLSLKNSWNYSCWLLVVKVPLR